MRNVLVSGLAVLCVTSLLVWSERASGQDDSPVSGGGAGGTSAGASDQLQRCPQTLGTIAINDGQGSQWLSGFNSATGVNSIDPLLRVMIGESNCFIIVSVGDQTDTDLQGITNEQRNSGEFRAGSNQQAGQRAAADYFMQPSIQFSAGDSGGSVGGLLSGIAGRFLPGVGNVSISQSGAQATFILTDIRSGEQIAAATGSASATNLGFSGYAWGRGDLSYYQNTPQGKVALAAFVNAYNNMVIAAENFKAQSVAGGVGNGGVLRPN